MNGAALLQNWGVAPTASVWIGGNNIRARSEIEAVAESLRGLPEHPIDCAFITPNAVDEASYFAEKLRSRLVADATVWVAWSSLDQDGLSAISSGLGAVGFDGIGDVTLSADLVTLGFRERMRADKAQ